MSDYQSLVLSILDARLDDEKINDMFDLPIIIVNLDEAKLIDLSQIIYFRRPSLYGQIFEDPEKKIEDFDDLMLSIKHSEIPDRHIFSKLKLCCQRHDLSREDINLISEDINQYRPKIGEQILTEIILPHYFQKEIS